MKNSIYYYAPTFTQPPKTHTLDIMTHTKTMWKPIPRARQPLGLATIALFIILLVLLSTLISCNRKYDEFSKLGINYSTSNQDPLAFLGNNSNTPETSASDALTLSQKSSFEPEYKNIYQWGKVEFSQKEKKINTYNNTELENLLIKSRKGKRQTIYYPVDTRIGPLQNTTNINYIDQKILEIIDKFFDLMKKVTLDKNLNSLILNTEIPVISRQITRSPQYGPEIIAVRVGELEILDTNKKTAAIRVIRKSENFEARATFQFYFIFVDNTWLINAIEGDFENLNRPYAHPGDFVPLGTTGITQGF